MTGPRPRLCGQLHPRLPLGCTLPEDHQLAGADEHVAPLGTVAGLPLWTSWGRTPAPATPAARQVLAARLAKLQRRLATSPGRPADPRALQVLQEALGLAITSLEGTAP